MQLRLLQGTKFSKMKWIGLLGLWLISQLAFAHQKLQAIDIVTQENYTQIQLNLSHQVSYKIFTLENPARVVIDIKDTRLNTKISSAMFDRSSIINIRHSVNEQGTLRVVLDLKAPLKIAEHSLQTKGKQGYQLQVGLGSKPAVKPLAQKQKSVIAQVLPQLKEIKAPKKEDPKPTRITAKEFVVAIDPGHGGEDTGAVGQRHQLREKDVVFAVSQQLKALINSQPGMKAYMVRNGDYFVPLRKRMALAREQGADLFISLHADAFNDPRATGASVFVLSEKGASNEAARWLAESENRSDLIGGVSLEDKGSLLASVLLDLSQTASQSASYELGNHIVGHLGKVTDLHHKTVQSAGFAVLKSPDIPSVLVELGFISNQQGEEKLLNPTHQRALANAILKGVKAYAQKRPLNTQEEWSVAKNKRAITVSAKG